MLGAKFAATLGFQSLFAVAVGLLLRTSDLSGVPLLPVWALWTFAGLWVTSTMYCLRGVGRLRWGDMWKFEPSQANDALEEYETELIEANVNRTARFRFAVLCTTLSVFVLLAGVGYGTLLAAGAQAGGNNTSAEDDQLEDGEDAGLGQRLAQQQSLTRLLEPIGRVGPFRWNETCSSRTPLREQVETIAQAVASSPKPAALLIVGSGDARAVRPDRDGFGNNVGVVQSRARCVSGWLGELFDQQEIELRVRLDVKDAANRTNEARDRGVEHDRFVEVYRLDTLPRESSSP